MRLFCFNHLKSSFLKYLKSREFKILILGFHCFAVYANNFEHLFWFLHFLCFVGYWLVFICLADEYKVKSFLQHLASDYNVGQAYKRPVSCLKGCLENYQSKCRRGHFMTKFMFCFHFLVFQNGLCLNCKDKLDVRRVMQHFGPAIAFRIQQMELKSPCHIRLQIQGQNILLWNQSYN